MGSGRKPMEARSSAIMCAGTLRRRRSPAPKAKVLNGERVRFEIAGGDYRLIASFHYGLKTGWIKFIGTHAEYDRVDALTVDQF